MFTQFLTFLKESADTVTLYRGDSSTIDNFDIGKTDPTALFGQGLYLTDNSNIAKQYTFKGVEEDPELLNFTMGQTSTIEDAEKFLNKHHKNADDYIISDHSGKYDKRRRKKRWFAYSKTKYTGNVTQYSVSTDVLNRCYDGDKRLSQKIIDILVPLCVKYNIMYKYNSAARTTQWYQDAFKYESEQGRYAYHDNGFNLNGFMFDKRSMYLNKIDAQGAQSFRDAMMKLGYAGIKYRGGKHIGTVKHNCYVLWDTSDASLT